MTQPPQGQGKWRVGGGHGAEWEAGRGRERRGTETASPDYRKPHAKPERPNRRTTVGRGMAVGEALEKLEV